MWPIWLTVQPLLTPGNPLRWAVRFAASVIDNPQSWRRLDVAAIGRSRRTRS